MRYASKVLPPNATTQDILKYQKAKYKEYRTRRQEVVKNQYLEVERYITKSMDEDRCNKCKKNYCKIKPSGKVCKMCEVCLDKQRQYNIRHTSSSKYIEEQREKQRARVVWDDNYS